MSPGAYGRGLAVGLLVAVWASPAVATAPGTVAAPAPGAAADHGAWIEGRLSAGMPWASYHYGINGAFTSTGAAISPFAVGYKVGRLYVDLGFDLSRISDRTYGAATDTVVWVGPAVGFIVIPARRHRPSFYVEGAFQVISGGVENGSGKMSIFGLGGRLAGGMRVFFLPDVGIGLEGGVAFDRIHLDIKPGSNSFPATDDYADLGLYGAITMVVALP